ncbi:MAG: TolC family protein [Gemmatimonadota bacterium]
MRRVTMLAAALAVASGAAAQDSTQAGGLTFEAALAYAREHNPAYLRAVNQVTDARYGETVQRSQMLPSADLSLSFYGNSRRTLTGENDFGQPVDRNSYTTFESSSASQGVSLTLPVLNLSALQQTRAARARTDAQRAAVALQRAQLRTTVGDAYFDVVRRRRGLAVERRLLATVQAQLEAARELLRVAAQQPTDVLGAEVQVAQQEQQVQAAEGEERKAVLALLQQMGASAATQLTLVSEFPPVFDPSTLDADALVAEAQRSAPQVREGLAQAEAADRSVSAARAARLPQLTLGGSASRNTNASGYSALGEFNPPNQSLTFYLDARRPLFSGFRTSAQIGQAKVAADNAREDLRAARIQVETDVRSALIDLENAYGSLRTAQRALDLAQQRLEQGQELYRLNNITFTDLQLMFQQAAQSERDVVNAQYGFLVARLTLEEKIGHEVH